MDHLDDLRETFETLRTYQMRLNPKKCIFGVSSGKFLGFLIDEKGIEANPDKIHAVINMTSPRTVKDVQRLTGCLAALGRFLSRAEDKCHYFFGTIKKGTQFEWMPREEAAFLRLKEHLHTLRRSSVSVPCHLRVRSKCRLAYRKGWDTTTSSSILPGSSADSLHRSTSKAAITNLEASRRMLNWEIELNAFDISYEPLKNEKTQWVVHVDGSATQNGSGAGIICESPEGDVYEYAMRFNFQASNNEAEYEALICGIQMRKAAGATDVLVLSDSQLIVSQVKGEYEAKDDAMIKYLEKVRQEVQQLSNFEIQHIPRSENNKADALSKLASSAFCGTPRHVFWEVKQLKSIDASRTDILDRTTNWMDDIVNFKMNGLPPDDPKQAERLQRKSTWFEICNGTLYKKAFSRPLLRCVTPEKGHEVLEDLHQGLCSAHIRGRALVEKA
ncbi:uncharacterized protein [Spinacia oleracea]|uniref:RNase H type-1 domain-containing protein n=1 Tax=Spinacia oleracea TaxID=3562 RepID=A0ABM3R880_SPIOL|nr:uncharacterized protein LOC130467348 [Spinacia oleracea]